MTKPEKATSRRPGPFSMCLLAIVGLSQGVFAQTASVPTDGKGFDVTLESPVILRLGGMTVTEADIDAYLEAQVPASRHGDLLRNAERLAELLQNLVNSEAFVSAARQSGMIEEEETRLTLYRVFQRELGRLYRERYLQDHALESYELRARELYLANPERFTSPRTVDLHHILITAGDERSEVDAMKRAIEAYERIAAGEDFTTVAGEYTDDPTFESNGGLLEGMNPDELVPQIAAALGRIEPGELSHPVRSRYGWHIVRLEKVGGETPLAWEDAREEAERIARDRHRELLIKEFLEEVNAQAVEFEGGAIKRLLDRYGVSLGEAPTDQDIQGKMGD